MEVGRITDTEKRAAAKKFASDWAGKGYEKGHSQAFWLSLLQKVYDVDEPDKFISFADQVLLDHTSFIDGFIPSTHVLIEQKSLNKLCVRLVFCLYAEDAGIFGGKSMFHDYLQAHEREARRALMDLFKVLGTKPEDRDPYMDEDLAAFPYVSGGLFADENIVIPRLDEKIVDLILHRASEDFDWSEISPTIFGAVFESILNPETRRSGGMHYTSIENIYKVIDLLNRDQIVLDMGNPIQVSIDQFYGVEYNDFVVTTAKTALWIAESQMLKEIEDVVHMAWMRAVFGRLKSDYDYSIKIVYNNFPWPTPTDEQKAKIEQTAQAILDARALYPDSSLADLYDETFMPPELRRAHQQNDKAVMQAYGISIKDMTESKCVAKLMRMYQELAG